MGFFDVAHTHCKPINRMAAGGLRGYPFIDFRKSGTEEVWLEWYEWTRENKRTYEGYQDFAIAIMRQFRVEYSGVSDGLEYLLKTKRMKKLKGGKLSVVASKTKAETDMDVVGEDQMGKEPPKIGHIRRLCLRARFGLDGKPDAYVICGKKGFPLRYCAEFSRRAEFVPFLEEFSTRKQAECAMVVLARKLGSRVAEAIAKKTTDEDIAKYFPEESQP